jgi:phosphotransacetylase
VTETLERAPRQAPSAGWVDQLAGGLRGLSRVVLAEGDDPRVRSAARRLADLGIPALLVCDQAHPGDPLPGTVETVTAGELARGPAGEAVEAQGLARGWAEAAVEERRGSALYLAAALVRLGSADAAVAGCRNPSGDVIRAGLHMIGLRPGHSTVSSSFLLRTPAGRSLAFGDCAVVPEPDETQLADIALATAGTFGSLTGEDPVVAMLSFSTLGSADHASVRRVREATRLVRERDPGLCVDGEMQFDAALVASVAEQKAAGSSVAGRANVFVFPNLAAGNIGYKIAQRLGGADAFGPILQGLRAPMNDLSRGCDAEDIVSVAVISVLQAQAG